MGAKCLTSAKSPPIFDDMKTTSPLQEQAVQEYRQVRIYKETWDQINWLAQRQDRPVIRALARLLGEEVRRQQRQEEREEDSMLQTPRVPGVGRS